MPNRPIKTGKPRTKQSYVILFCKSTNFFQSFSWKHKKTLDTFLNHLFCNFETDPTTDYIYLLGTNIGFYSYIMFRVNCHEGTALPCNPDAWNRKRLMKWHILHVQHVNSHSQLTTLEALSSRFTINELIKKDHVVFDSIASCLNTASIDVYQRSCSRYISTHDVRNCFSCSL